MQSQDRNQHLRAIASRAWCSQEDILQAYNEGKIVRTRTQRGTIHVTSAEDARWMTTLCGSKTLTSFARRRQSLGITDDQSEKALTLLQNYLADGPKIRKDIISYRQSHGIAEGMNHGYHLLCYAGTLGLIVQWPIIDGEQAFVLSKQWIKNPKIYSKEESLRELCLRYFTSHGPATLEDLQRWSGLWKTLLKQGIESCGNQLIQTTVDGKEYYSWKSKPSKDIPIVYFLAWFDERLLGYKDRSATVHTDHLTRIDVSRNGVFKPTVMIDGITVAIWQIKHRKYESDITITPFHPLSQEQISLLHEWIISYQKYLNKPLTISIADA